MSQSRPAVAWVRALVGAAARAVAAVATDVTSRSRNVRVRALAGAAALLGAVPLAATRLVVNSPLHVPGAASAGWYELVRLAALVGPATAAVALGVTADRELERVGLLSVGVFGLLSAVTSAVAVPTVGALVAGGWLVVAGQFDRRPGPREAVAGALVGGLTLSLVGAAGYRPVAFRSAGTTAALLGMAATPLAVRAGRRGLAVGGLVAVGAYALILEAPFVSGAVALAAGAAIDPPSVLLALAVGGTTATVADGLSDRRVSAAVGGTLLLVAGVPASIPRGVSVAVAVAFLLAAASGGDST
ncbi:phosphate ABC transporter permease [Halorussus salinisoli]|uniref:phosphate ABC transporter permease n=1 Tax=Halorussus salinisoli TaxID=2558242 RepID=UPI0010C1F779|nr:phosphate ABC transporter permease [Halorussus salinisoli]